MRHQKPDEWRITRACAKGWTTVRCSQPESLHVLLATPTASPGRCQPSQCSPLSLASAHLRWQTAGRREITLLQMGATYFGWTIQALCPCHMSLTLVFRSDNTSRQGLFTFGLDTKGNEGEEKLTRPLFAQAQILWKSRHWERNQIKSQQKQSTPRRKKKSCLAPLWFPSPRCSS